MGAEWQGPDRRSVPRDPAVGVPRRWPWAAVHHLKRAAVLLVATGLTHLVFPLFYGGITTAHPWSVWVVLALAARNLALVWLLLEGLAEAWRRVSAASRSSASRPGPTGTTHAPSGGAPTTPGADAPAPG